MNSTIEGGSNSSLNFSPFHAAVVFSRFFFVVLTFSTIVGNGLFLLTFYKDPLKCLRTPSAIFIAGMTFTNFLTGLIVEPVIVLSRFVDNSKDFVQFFRVVEIFAFITLNTSFFIMLALAVVHFLAISHPRVYEIVVSPKKAIVGIIAIWIYVSLFSLLTTMGVSFKTFVMVDHVLHTTMLTVILMILYILIYYKFRQISNQQRFMESGEGRSPQQVSGQIGENEQQRRQLEKDFALGTFSLTLLLFVTVWPFGIVLYIWLLKLFYFSFSSEEEVLRIYVAFLYCQVFLFFKFALDPFVFAWRLKKYRKSLVLSVESTFPCCKPPRPPAVYHRDDMVPEELELREFDITIVEEHKLENTTS